MTENHPKERPVPGREALTDLRDPIQALVQFYRAFNNRDLDLMEKTWEHSSEVAGIGPLADIVRGWPAILRGYGLLFRGPVRITTEFYDYTIHRSDNIFYAIGRERGQSTAGGKTTEIEGRATNIFRRGEDGAWKLVHHHISVESPQLLATPPIAERDKSTHPNSVEEPNNKGTIRELRIHPNDLGS